MSSHTTNQTNELLRVRDLLVVTLVAALLLSVFANSAAAAPQQHLLPPFVDDEVEVFPSESPPRPPLCDFPVELAVERGRLGVLFFDDGSKVLHPGLFVRVTSLDTGGSVVVNTTGTIHLRAELTADGGSRTTVQVTGHGLLLFSPQGFVHAVGRTVITLERDGDGNLTSPPTFDLSRARTTDVCAQLSDD